MNGTPGWSIVVGSGPLVATAIHDGHDLRPEVADLSALPDSDRLREEDPFTAQWVDVAPTQITVSRSRFEVDLNRPRDKAVYRRSEDAWGLEMWTSEPDDDVVGRSLEAYDAFYQELDGALSLIERKHGRFIVLDLHSYNHRREGPDALPEEPAANPEVNIGTGTLNRDRWGIVVDRFIDDLGGFDFNGRSLDVRENVRFQGGHLARWIHERFPNSGCALAIEFKKIFMDEWSGIADEEMIASIHDALEAATPGLLESLGQVEV